jgi:rubrerythrin
MIDRVVQRQRNTSDKGAVNLEEKMKLEEAWRLAIEREQEARDFYAEMAEMIEDSALKNLFAFLIKQEENHKQLLEEEYEKLFAADD